MLIVGDSFTSGHGLKSADERYGNILADKIGKEYVTYNLGISGSDTRDEYARLEKFGKSSGYPGFTVLPERHRKGSTRSWPGTFRLYALFGSAPGHTVAIYQIVSAQLFILAVSAW